MNKDRVVKAIQDIIWMARRYADGRQTYAPSMFNDAQDVLVEELGFEIVGREDPTVESFPQAEEVT